MARAYSLDLRERVLQAEAAGLAPSEIERTLGISRRTVRRWHQRRDAGDSLVPGQSSGRPRKIAPDQDAALRDQVTAHPDATLADHCRLWQQAQGVTVSRATMGRALARLGWPLKKNGDRAGTRSGGAGDVSDHHCHPRSGPSHRPR